MSLVFLSFLILASKQVSYTYGYGEKCSHKTLCLEGVSRTASGDILSREIPSVAVPLPKHVKLEPHWIYLKTERGPCVRVKVNDRTSVRLVGHRGFDLSPEALRRLTGKASKTWSGKVHICYNFPLDFHYMY